MNFLRYVFKNLKSRKIRELITIGLITILISSSILCRFYLKYPFEDKYYPFWSMDLFSRVKFESRSYLITLHQVDETLFENEISLYDHFPIKDTETFSPHILIEQMGLSLSSGDEAKYQQLKSDFERKMFSSNKFVKYTLNQVEYQNVEKLKLDKTLKNKFIRSEEYKSK